MLPQARHLASGHDIFSAVESRDPRTKTGWSRTLKPRTGPRKFSKSGTGLGPRKLLKSRTGPWIPCCKCTPGRAHRSILLLKSRLLFRLSNCAFMGISHMIFKPHIGHNMAVITNLLNVLTLARHQCALFRSRTIIFARFRTIYLLIILLSRHWYAKEQHNGKKKKHLGDACQYQSQKLKISDDSSMMTHHQPTRWRNDH